MRRIFDHHTTPPVRGCVSTTTFPNTNPAASRPTRAKTGLRHRSGPRRHERLTARGGINVSFSGIRTAYPAVLGRPGRTPSATKTLFGGGLDLDSRFCHTFPMPSLRQTGSGMISAYAGRCRPKSDFLSIAHGQCGERRDEVLQSGIGVNLSRATAHTATNNATGAT